MVVIVSLVVGRREEVQVVYVSRGGARPVTDMPALKLAKTSPMLDSMLPSL